MYCTKCGSEIKDNNICPNCYSISDFEVTPVPLKKRSAKKIIVILTICFLLIALLICFKHISDKKKLHNELMRDWENIEVGDSITDYYYLILDFSKDEIEYIFDCYYFEETIATYEYEVLSGTKFKLEDDETIYTVEFDDDKSMMTISPALTSSDEYEYWFNFDD